ncbi:hypothetical protein TSOC_014843, partial [Tetrabaena socialis]
MQRTAVVSGVARPCGIGRAITRTLLTQGYRVVGCDAAPEEAPDTPAPAYSFLRVDITSERDVQALRRHVEGVAGGAGLHALVNNAGVAQPFMDATDPLRSWRAFIDTNLTGAFLMSQALQPLMVEGASAIVHISSTRALQSEPGC